MRAPSPAARPPWRTFSDPMAVVEVCVVAWLAWGVVSGLLGLVWGGSGLVLLWLTPDLGEVLVWVLGNLGPQVVVLG